MAAGSRLGPYEILSPRGAGGMGEMYKARDTRLDRTVAVKILPDALAADSHCREQFDCEAHAISQLTHPHICTVYAVGGRARREIVERLPRRHMSFDERPQSRRTGLLDKRPQP